MPQILCHLCVQVACNTCDKDCMYKVAEDIESHLKPAAIGPSLLRVFPLCALVPRVQDRVVLLSPCSLYGVATLSPPTTRAGPWPDFALRLE